MTALWEYAKAAIALLPGTPGQEPLGRVVPISGLTTTTIVAATQLAFGGVDEQAYAQKWMWRPLAASTADMIRFSDSFAPASGTLTHSGTNYSDTTATNEYAVITPFAPNAWREAIQKAITTIMGLDETIVPIVQAQEWHWLHELDWIVKPSQIRMVERNNSPVITRDRYLQKRHSYNSAGLFLPDYWTVANNAATAPFVSPAYYRNQKTYYSLERNSTNATLSQSVSAQMSGVSGDLPIGETITAVVVCESDTAGDVKIAVDAGNSDSTNSSTTNVEEVTATATLTSVAGIDTTVTAQTSDAAQKIFEIYTMIGDLTDTVRRDNYPRSKLLPSAYHFEQGGPLRVHNPSMGRGQIIVTSERPFPAFDATRFGTGAADVDESDAPIDVVAVGAIFYLFRAKFGEGHPETKAWEKKFDSLKMSHLGARTEDGHAGFRMMGSPIAAPWVSVR